MNSMKLKLFLILIFLAKITFAQDLIKFKNIDTLNNDTNQSVKIIYVGDTILYYYQQSDLLKNIKIAHLRSISEFQYNSIEFGKNKQTISSDSILFINHIRKNKAELPLQLNWDKYYSIDLITTVNGEKFKVKVISKDNQHITFKIFDENSILSKKTLKYSVSLVSSIDLNTSYFYGKSFFDNNIILIDKVNLSINAQDYYTYYDYLKGFGTTELRVKIINVDDKYITYFLPSDSIISIKQISLNSVKKYKYLSIENNNNAEVIKKDMELYLDYLDSKFKKQENQSKNGYEKSVFASKEVNSIRINSFPINEFQEASNNLTYAGILILGGGLLHILASRNLTDISDLNSRSNMAKIGTLMYCGAGIFVISASVNIKNGAINLK